MMYKTKREQEVSVAVRQICEGVGLPGYAHQNLMDSLRFHTSRSNRAGTGFYDMILEGASFFDVASKADYQNRALLKEWALAAPALQRVYRTHRPKYL